MRAVQRHRLLVAIMLLVALAALLASLALGRYGIPIDDVVRLLWDRALGIPAAPDDPTASILIDVRLPRIAAAFLVGGALALSGAAYQGLFRNPMVSPDLLGASAGAGCGAALAILLAWHPALVQAAAFTGGLLAVGIALGISGIVARGAPAALIVLVLTGVLVSTIFTACIAMAKFVADPDNALPAITFWLMGSLAGIRSGHLGWLLPVLLCGICPLLVLRWRLNVLAFGEDEASALGLDVRRVRLVIICCATLLTSASVAMCGMIGFVGLVIPHMARLLLGADHALVLPASLLLGGTFLVIVDDVARCAFPVELPLGILCSLVGAPFFLYLLCKGRSSWA